MSVGLHEIGRRKGKFIYKVLIAASLLTISGVGVLSALSTSIAERTLLQGVETQTRLVGEAAALSIANWLDGRQRLLENLGQTIAANGAAEGVERLLGTQALTESFNPVFFGRQDGVFLLEPPTKLPDGYDPRKRGWYESAVAAKRTVITKPYKSASNDALTITIAQPVRGDAGFAGVAGGDMELTRINELLSGLALDGKGYAFLVDAEGTVLVHPDRERVLKRLSDNFDPARLTAGGDAAADQGDAMTRFFPITGLSSVKWYVGISMDRAKVMAPVASFRSVLVGISITTVVLLVVLLGGLIYRLVSRPITQITATMGRLAQGDTDTEIPAQHRTDEIGDIARTVEVFKQNLLHNREMEREAKEQETRAAADKKKAMHDLAQRFEGRVGSIVSMVGSAATELQATASQLAAAVDEATGQCTAVAAASEQASASVQTVAAASEEMSAAIRELSNRVMRAAERSRTAASGTGQVRCELDALAGAIDQVDQIVAAINAVAAQTNLLALNATIEAARAGEAGKGFAVVASEVKNLANQTHSMTEQIDNQIAAVKSASGRTVDAMQSIIGQVGEIDHATAEMAASIEQQSVATSEISRNAQQASVGTAEVVQNITGIQRAEADTSDASQNVKQAADTLAEQSALLKREVDNFLAEVRAA